MKLDWRNWFHKRRFAQDWERAKQAALSTPLEAYYDVPLPEQMSLDDTPLVALDFESDGLEKNAQLLEAGWTRIIDRAIKLETAQKTGYRNQLSSFTALPMMSQQAGNGSRQFWPCCWMS